MVTITSSITSIVPFYLILQIIKEKGSIPYVWNITSGSVVIEIETKKNGNEIRIRNSTLEENLQLNMTEKIGSCFLLYADSNDDRTFLFRADLIGAKQFIQQRDPALWSVTPRFGPDPMSNAQELELAVGIILVILSLVITTIIIDTAEQLPILQERLRQIQLAIDQLYVDIGQRVLLRTAGVSGGNRRLTGSTGNGYELVPLRAPTRNERNDEQLFAARRASTIQRYQSTINELVVLGVIDAGAAIAGIFLIYKSHFG